MIAVDLDLLDIIKDKKVIKYNELLEICTSNGNWEKYQLDFELENMSKGNYITVENDIIKFVGDTYGI